MEFPRPLAVGSAIAKAVRPFYMLWMYVPYIPDILGIRERAKKRATEAILMWLIQSAVRGLL
jgi:hypothetical protein